MTLRRRVLIYITTGLLISISCLIFISHLFLSQGFNNEENREMTLNVKRALASINNRLTELGRISSDYARWDDTYSFVENSNEKYIRTNLVETTFSNLRVNLIAIVHSSGRIVFARNFDLEKNDWLPLPATFASLLRPGSRLTNHGSLESELKGIVLFPEGPMLIASQPILTSNELGPIRGTLIMGRYLDEPSIQGFAELTQLSFSVRRLDEKQLPAAFRSAFPQITPRKPIYIKPLNNDLIAGYAILNDIFGHPALILQVSNTREIFKQGQMTINAFSLILIAVGLAIIGFVVFLLDRMILARLSELNLNVKKIGLASDPTLRVRVSGRDELAGLAAEINRMLGALNDSRQQLAENELKFKTLFESSPEAIYLETMDEGRIADCNQAAVKMTGYTKEELLGMSARDLVPEETARTFPSLVESILKTSNYFARALNKKKNGEIIPVEVNIRLVEIGEKRFSLVVVHDVSDRKRTEEELNERVRQLEEFHDLTVGRELKMVELEKEINGLLRELGREPKYKL